MILIVLMICSFAVATTEFVLVGMLNDIAGSLHVSVAAAGLLVTAYMVVVTVGGPVAALVTRRIPRRGLLIAAMVVAAAAAIASALSVSYSMLMTARMVSALAQALFLAVASQAAMASAAPGRQTAAVARVFNGFALATVIGLPAGTLIGEAFGWRATFALVAVLSAIGLAGLVVWCPPIAATPDDRTGPVTPDRRVATALGVTLFALTGFVAAFTYIAPALRSVTGTSGFVTGIALVVYGLGTIAGNALAGRVPAGQIVRVLPVPLGVLAVALATFGLALRGLPSALVAVFVLGASTFVIVPLVQTWLMERVGPARAGFIAAVNISVAGLAGAVGAAVGSAVLSHGFGVAAIGPVAAPTAAVALALSLTLAPRRAVARQTAAAQLCDAT